MRIIFKKIFTIFIFLLVIMPCLYPQVPTREQIIDTVRCREVTGQSYALFQPAQYDNRKSWPVILIFDPAARGRTGVNTFTDAARKYGFILACSNNSRNGPQGDNFIAAAAMLQDIEARFNIDQKRIYVSGFSGGSRFAMSYAMTEKRVSGIIGCGAGLPNDRNYIPTGNSNFLYYGMAGTRDMNYLEMFDLLEFFNNQTKVTSYLRTFSGGHQWPTPDLMTEAVEWLILQAMNRKIIPADQTFLSYDENKIETLINSMLSAGNKTDAVRYMKFAARDFQGTPFAVKLQQSLTDLENSPDYKTANRKWKKMIATEGEKKEECLKYLSEILSSGSIPDSASVWWSSEIRSLVRLRDRDSGENSQMASRVMNFISILCSEQGISFYKNKFYSQAAFLFEICTLSDSTNPNNYFNLAKSLAQAGKTKKSLDALSAAVDHGFKSKKSIEADPAFAIVRADDRYDKVIGKMKTP
jgi:hypothetical protein